jgi:endonuclease/exonuclease/phosphatase family metal-dependent hydrolase
MQAAIRSLNADLIGLQEVDRRVVRSWFRHQPRLAARAAGLDHRFADARALGPFGRYGNALLVPAGPVDLKVLRLESAGEARVALFARVRVCGVMVTVVNAHLQNRSGGGPGEAPAQLDGLLAELSHWPAPWIVMGDLNLRPKVVEPRFRAAGLIPADTPPTFPSTGPEVRIDWIGVRGLRVCSVTVPSLGASDHLPIVVDLELDDPGASLTVDGVAADQER